MMMKCTNENCDYFKINGECSSVCEKRNIKKVITQFDRITSMTIDEMVDFILKETDQCDLCSRKNCPTCVDIEGGCAKYIKEYLESEVNDNA